MSRYWITASVNQATSEVDRSSSSSKLPIPCRSIKAFVCDPSTYSGVGRQTISPPKVKGLGVMCGCLGVWVYGCMGLWVKAALHPHTQTPTRPLPSPRGHQLVAFQLADVDGHHGLAEAG